MKYGAIRVGVRNMNSNIRPTIYIKKVFRGTWVIVTPNGYALDCNKERIVFMREDLDKAGAMVTAIRKSMGQF